MSHLITVNSLGKTFNFGNSAIFKHVQKMYSGGVFCTMLSWVLIVIIFILALV